MKKVILITGANGMLAQQLNLLLEKKYSIRFLTRSPQNSNEYQWDLKKDYIDPKALIDVNYIIHLAGASIADKPWTETRKQEILSSRIDSGQLILKQLEQNNITLDAFISASAIGYYGATTSDVIFNEESPKGNDFLSDVCAEWENSAHSFKTSSNRISIVRVGIILSLDGGMLEKIVPTIKYGIGSGIGKGNQFIPWIHINDLCRVFEFLLENESISGTFNAVAPEHITNIELTKKTAKVLNRKIFLLNLPSWLVRFIFGEKSSILLNGSRVSSEKITKQGFKFNYKKLDEALKDLFSSPSNH